MIAISIAIFLGAWGLQSSSTPQIARVEHGRYDQSPPAYNQSDASPHPAPIAEPRGNKRQKENRNESTETNPFLAFCERWQTPINLFSAVLVAIFTGLLTFFTVKLWRSGEKHSERELRAYVITGGAVVSRLVENDEIKASINLINGGETPAYEIATRSEIWIDDFPTQRTLTDDWRPTTLPIGPGNNRPLFPVRSGVLTEQEKINVVVGHQAIFVVAEIRYRDVFDKIRTTKFKAVFFNPDQDKPTDGGLALTPTVDGNECT